MVYTVDDIKDACGSFSDDALIGKGGLDLCIGGF